MSSTVQERFTSFSNQLSKAIYLIAVSKEQPLEKIEALYELGHRDFGENRAQALETRYKRLPKDIRWHMIGHLQRNKVRLIAPFTYLIQSVDSIRLLKEINQEGKKQNRVLRCLLQLHIAKNDPQKHGLNQEELSELLQTDLLDHLSYVQIEGLMGMASHVSDEQHISSEFAYLRSEFERIKKNYTHSCLKMHRLSVGMSNDYQIALKEGSNMLRIGSAIFGPRVAKET